MTKTWESFSPRHMAAAERIFDALCTIDQLTGLDNEPAAPRPGVTRPGVTRPGVTRPGVTRSEETPVNFHHLYRYVSDPRATMATEMTEAVRRDPRLRQNLRRLLEKSTVCHFPRVAAASSGEAGTGQTSTGRAVRRQGQGFQIYIRPSKADPRHVYVIITVTGKATPHALFVCSARHEYQKHPLPPVHDGTIQILAEADSDLVLALSDNASEVFIR